MISSIPKTWSIEDDFEHILSLTQDVFLSLRGASIFMTGGTGFIGCWLLESLRYADMQLGLGVKVTILTRDIDAFKLKAAHLTEYKNFKFIEGEISSFEFPEGVFTHVIHAATDASADLNEKNPIGMFNTLIDGTRRVLDFALEKKTSRLLYLSSGAVYGQQPWEMEHVNEEWIGSPNCVDPRATYAEGKRAAEMVCAIYGKQYGLQISIARIFALLGPYLSLGIHFAAGNFIKDAMQSKSIVVKGNGAPCRSYLYASDLTIWLWHMLQRGAANKPYNVGSHESVSICQLAQRVSKVLNAGDYQLLNGDDQGWNLGRYVPDTKLIGQDLGLYKTVSLDEAIRRTALWNGWKENN